MNWQRLVMRKKLVLGVNVRVRGWARVHPEQTIRFDSGRPIKSTFKQMNRFYPSHQNTVDIVYLAPTHANRLKYTEPYQCIPSPLDIISAYWQKSIQRKDLSSNQ